MKYIVDESLTQFRFWSGAKDNAAMLTYSELERVNDYLEDISMGGGRATNGHADKRPILV